MMTGSSGPNGNWDRWVFLELGALKASVQAVHQRIEDNRQSAFRELWLVRRELLGNNVHMVQRRSDQWAWMRHVPWTKITALSILAILVATGVVSGAEVKAWLLRKIIDF